MAPWSRSHMKFSTEFSAEANPCSVSIHLHPSCRLAGCADLAGILQARRSSRYSVPFVQLEVVQKEAHILSSWRYLERTRAGPRPRTEEAAELVVRHARKEAKTQAAALLPAACAVHDQVSEVLKP